jgi:hypothetical protein
MEIRAYKDSDENKIRGLFHLSFGREMSHNEWLWKYKKSPWGSVAYVVVDDNDNDNIIAHYGAIRHAFILEGSLLWAFQACDVMTHPAYRGKMTGKRPFIMQACEKFIKDNTMDILFGFPSERNARLHEIVLGFSKYRKTALFRRQLEGSSGIKANPYVLKIGWDTIDPADLDDLWKISKTKLSLSIVKNSRYLLWRYLENPSGYYTLITFKDVVQKKIIGSAVVKFSGHEMNIFDIFVQDDAFSSFLIMLEAYALKMQAETVNVRINPEEIYSEYLAGLNYRIIEDIPLFVKILNESKISQDNFFRKYSCRIGDSL